MPARLGGENGKRNDADQSLVAIENRQPPDLRLADHIDRLVDGLILEAIVDAV